MMILLKKRKQLHKKRKAKCVIYYFTTSVHQFTMILRRQHHHYIIGGGGAFWKYTNQKFANLPILSQWILVIYSIHINMYNTDKHLCTMTHKLLKDLSLRTWVKTNEINRSLFKLLATPENYPIKQLYTHMHWKFCLVIDRIAK